jgi:hypothetical protein
MTTDGPKAVTAEERVRLYAELVDCPSLGGEIVYDQRYKTEDWPRTAYALEKHEVLGVLDELVLVREENTLQRQDIENLQNEKEDLELAREDWVIARNEMSRSLETLCKELADKDRMIASLRVNGGEHWFSYGYQKVTNVMLGHWVDHCKVCDKSRDDPSHFGNGTKALSSTVVEEAMEVVRKRLVEFLQRSGVRVTDKAAQEAALDLLGDLPGGLNVQGSNG